MLGAGGGGM
ncbi:hypothetical protein NGA_0483700 [Nannochloropsis gaditana CCMP526]|nr:hypothetical protein NGA_0483700 [Nannochloropsis gaditana CCMP526]EKU22716.1 hypothetical protein NGA_0483700 [Nannochloropsis gaditana CCMP526]|eukprot:XP_005853644.1 hypothetical protein NGA_0483700 [Nannochloropsis gaditana CCMP526]